MAALVGLPFVSVFAALPAKSRTALVSVNAAGTGGGNDESDEPSISADGRFVAFSSRASDVISGDTNGVLDVFVRDVKTGKTTLVSANAAGTGGGLGYPSIGGNGRFVAFESDASDIVAGDTIGTVDVFVRDVKKGTTTLVSRNLSGTGTGNGSSLRSSISADGRWVAFVSHASDLVTGGTTRINVFVRDMRSGTTRLVSANAAGTGAGDGESTAPSISADGRFVASHSYATDLAPGDLQFPQDIFVRDMKAHTTTLVSWNASGTRGGAGSSYYPTIASNGRFVAFQSAASDLLEADTNGVPDIFVRDVRKGTTTLVSVNASDTASGNDGSREASISADGRFVAFSSFATDLVPGGTSGINVFVRRVR